MRLEVGANPRLRRRSRGLINRSQRSESARTCSLKYEGFWEVGWQKSTACWHLRTQTFQFTSRFLRPRAKELLERVGRGCDMPQPWQSTDALTISGVHWRMLHMPLCTRPAPAGKGLYCIWCVGAWFWHLSSFCKNSGSWISTMGWR